MSSAGRWVMTFWFIAPCMLVPLAGLSWCRDNAKLLQQTEHIKVDPVVGHSAIHDPKNARAGGVDDFAGRGHALEGAAIRPAQAEASGDLVAFGKYILDLDTHVGER